MYSIKLNLSDSVVQYRASTMVEGCQVSRLGHLLQYMREYCTVYNAESQKQDSKKFKSHGRQNTLPIWIYYLSMGHCLSSLER